MAVLKQPSRSRKPLKHNLSLALYVPMNIYDPVVSVPAYLYMVYQHPNGLEVKLLNVFKPTYRLHSVAAVPYLLLGLVRLGI